MLISCYLYMYMYIWYVVNNEVVKNYENDELVKKVNAIDTDC